MTESAALIQDRLQGISIGLLTPFDETGAIDYDALADNASDLAAKGPRSFLAAANISEFHSLSHDERVRSVETAVEAVPDDACVLAGVGGSTPAAKDLVRAYEAAGADGMMVMPPDHTYIHERGLLTYYQELAAATERPLVPYIRGFDPSVEFLGDMTRLDAVVAVKYALEDMVKLGQAINAGTDDVIWVNGLAEPLAVAAWAEGIDGFTAGVSNFRPAVGMALFEALENGEWERARALRNATLPFQQFRSETGTDNTLPGAVSVPVVKRGLELAGLHGGNVREPIVPLTAAERDRVDSLYEELDDRLAELIS